MPSSISVEFVGRSLVTSAAMAMGAGVVLLQVATLEARLAATACDGRPMRLSLSIDASADSTACADRPAGALLARLRGSS